MPVVAGLEADGGLDLVELVDHPIAGIDFSRRATGCSTTEEAVRALATRDRAYTVVTAEARGCSDSECGGEVQTLPALRVPVVDTTGCGDVFHGAYALCIARDLGVDRAMLVATVTAESRPPARADARASRTGDQ
jgi:sugar/nucleoside kinase (ribokinase family)